MTDQALNQIERLIRQDETNWEGARAQLRRLLKRNPESAPGWWLYAKVAPDLDEAHMALENVLILAPDHQQAARALEILKRQRKTGKADLIQPLDGATPEAARPSFREQVELWAGAIFLSVVLFVGAVLLFVAIAPRLAVAARLPVYQPISVAKQLPVLVEICVPDTQGCAYTMPRVHNIAEDYAGRVEFVFVNLADAGSLTEREYQLYLKADSGWVPTYGFIDRHGQLIDQFVVLYQDSFLRIFRQKLDNLARNY